MTAHRHVALALCATLIASTSFATAQDEAAAEAQFKRGLDEMLAGRFDTGCPAIAESYRLDPQPGALFTLAECEAKWGKLASAVTHYEAYLEAFAHLTPALRSKQLGRDAVARKQVAALEPVVPFLTIRLAASVPAGTNVSRDGVPLGPASLGVALPTDPGEHVLRVEPQQGAAREERIRLERGERRTVELTVDAVEPARAASPSAGGAASAVPAQPSIDSATNVAPQHGSRTPLLVAAVVVAAAGLAVGGVTGVLAIQKQKVRDDNCQDLACNADGIRAVENGRTLGIASTIGFAAAAVGLTTAVVLWLTAPGRGASSSASAKRGERVLLGPNRTAVEWAW